MSLVKMTDILVSTSAFIVTLTYQGHDKALLEVTPIGRQGPDWSLAEKFFHSITSDSSQHNARSKRAWLNSFISGCSKRIVDEFWDNAQWKTLEGLCLRVPYITCLLYDKNGDVAASFDCLTYEVLWALQRVEEAFFAHSLAQKAPVAFVDHSKKAQKRDLNRQTHKYFLHHRSPR